MQNHASPQGDDIRPMENDSPAAENDIRPQGYYKNTRGNDGVIVFVRAPSFIGSGFSQERKVEI
jgi:hypothetical protein